MPVGVRVGVLRLLARLVSFGRGSACRSVGAAGWVIGLGGGVFCWGVRRIVLCGAQPPWGAAGAAGVGASTFVGWRGVVSGRAQAWTDVPGASAFSSCLPQGLLQAPGDIRVVLGRGEVAGVDSLGVERIGQHGFPCSLWHPTPRRLEAAVLCRPLAVSVDQALEGGLCPGPVSQLPELRVGPALLPLSPSRAVAAGGGVGVGGCDEFVWTGGGGGPRGFFVVLCRGGVGGVGGRADMDLQVRAHGLSLMIGLGIMVAAVAGDLLYVCYHQGLVGGRGRCWWTLALFWSGPGVVHGPGVQALRGGGTKCVRTRPPRAPP